MDRPYSMLFISRRNTARSLMAEAVVNRHGKNQFRAFSAAVDLARLDAIALQKHLDEIAVAPTTADPSP